MINKSFIPHILTSEIFDGRRQIKPDLASLLRGQVNNLLLPLDARSSRVSLTRLGDLGLCRKTDHNMQLGLETNVCFDNSTEHFFFPCSFSA